MGQHLSPRDPSACACNFPSSQSPLTHRSSHLSFLCFPLFSVLREFTEREEEKKIIIMTKQTQSVVISDAKFGIGLAISLELLAAESCIDISSSSSRRKLLKNETQQGKMATWVASMRASSPTRSRPDRASLSETEQHSSWLVSPTTNSFETENALPTTGIGRDGGGSACTFETDLILIFLG